MTSVSSADLTPRQRAALAEPKSRRIVSAHRLEGSLDKPRLEEALARLVCRHPALRTAYQGGRHPRAWHVRPYAPRLESAAAGIAIKELAERPSDLESGHALQAYLAGDRLILLVEHLSADLRSMEIIHRDLGALYRRTTPPDCGTEFSEFAAGQRELVEGAIPWPPLRDLTGPSDGAHLAFDVGSAVAEQVATLARKAGTTEFVVCLAALLTVLRTRGGRFPLVYTADARPAHSFWNTVGWFNNRIIIQTPGDIDVDMLRWTQGTVLDRFARPLIRYPAGPEPIQFFFTDRGHFKRGELDLGPQLRVFPLPTPAFDDTTSAPLRMAVSMTWDHSLRIEADGRTDVQMLTNEYVGALSYA